MTMTESEFLRRVVDVAQEAALLAGQVIRDASAAKQQRGQRQGHHDSSNVDENDTVTNYQKKVSNTDLMTETDRRCKDMIRRSTVKNDFPGMLPLLAKEDCSDKAVYELTGDPTWT